MHSDIICGLDIGTSSIRALIAQPLDSSHEKEKILGFSESPTKGFSKGVVSNLSLLSDAIEDAVSKVEASAHCKVRKVVTNISGVHIRTFKSRGAVHISDRPSEITKADINRCIESAKLIAMSLDRETIHLIPERFFIDDKMEIDDPLALFGSKLDVDLNIITTLVSILQNLTKAVNLAGYEVEDVAASGAATSLAVFNEKDLKEGTVIIDVGKDLTESSMFMDGKLRDCFYFPFGSDELTQVLQDKLKIMFEDAEALRKRYGIITKTNEELYDESPILIPSLRNRPVSRREISNLLFPKVEEIMQDVYKKIEPFLKQKKNLPHVSVVGGTVKMDGFVEAIEEIFGVPVDMARLLNTKKDFFDTTFACSLGLVRYGALRRLEKSSKQLSNVGGITGRVFGKIRSILSDYF